MISQFGVLAYHVGPDGEPRFMLITSRRTKRWVIPRGNPIRGLSPPQSAAQEAYEEAGITGLVSGEAIGSYQYQKIRGNGAAVLAEVQVFPLRTTIQSGHWPERHQRETAWFTRQDAAAAVDEAGLKELILGFVPPAASASRVSTALLSAAPPPPAKFRVLKLFKAIMPRDDSFFEMLARHSESLVSGADAMGAMFSGQAGIEECCTRITDYEHQADAVTREVLLAVRRSFRTPFDRGAISRLISSMDDAIDEMRHTAKAIMLYEVESFAPQMCEMAALAGQAARLIAEGVPLLRAVARNGAQLDRITENIVHLEGAADDLHEQGLKTLFQTFGEDRPMAFFIGHEVYNHLERVLDRFEDVANEIQGIVIKHA